MLYLDIFFNMDIPLIWDLEAKKGYLYNDKTGMVGFQTDLFSNKIYVTEILIVFWYFIEAITIRDIKFIKNIFNPYYKYNSHIFSYSFTKNKANSLFASGVILILF